jgi:hypothetical protein
MTKPWGIYEDGEDLHIIPIDDTRHHDYTNCWCDPDIEVIGARIKYRHNSHDGREYVEQVKEMLGIGDVE